MTCCRLGGLAALRQGLSPSSSPAMWDRREDPLQAERSPRCVLGKRNTWVLCHHLKRSQMVLRSGEGGRIHVEGGGVAERGRAVTWSGASLGKQAERLGQMVPVQRQHEGMSTGIILEHCLHRVVSICSTFALLGFRKFCILARPALGKGCETTCRLSAVVL